MNNNVMPVRRNLEFKLPADRIHDWNRDGNVHISHFMNALSIFFPSGERFFIDSVRYFRNDITDPEQKEAVKAFIGQEAMHGREHEEYNEALVARGLPADRYENFIIRMLGFFKRNAPRRSQLAATIALEHITAILAERVLSTPELLQGAEPRYKALWRWHALEETEHKAVAFDVYKTVMPNSLLSYTRRVMALLISSFMFFGLAFVFHIGLLSREKGQLWNIRGWLSLIAFLWGPRGALLRMIPEWLSYFRPGFHPWDHDNRAHLETLDSLVAEVEAFPDASAA